MKLTIENIKKKYDRDVIKGISHEFVSGKLYVIKGVSGSGKSTCLNILGGIESEYEGRIMVDGEDANVKTLSGYVFQKSLLLSGLTIYENLLLIKNDKSLINKLCDDYGVTELLYKYPEQISGGERQRITIIRALLLNPQIILADEPTASLDESNSMNVAECLSELCNEGKIVIVATHEHYFDEFADEIIHLKYGVIDKIDEKNQSVISYEEKNMVNSESDRYKGIGSFKYNLKRNRKQIKLPVLLPFILMFLLIFAASTVQNNFEEQYMRSLKDKYPVDAFNIYDFELLKFPDSKNVIIYDYYEENEEDVTALYLADEKYSVFSIDGMIKYGEFPSEAREILVSPEYIEKLYGSTENIEKYLGTTIVFMEDEYIIKGILAGEKFPEFNSYRSSDIYYRNKEANTIYIPYKTMEAEFSPKEYQYGGMVALRGYYKGLFDDEKFVNKAREVFRSGNINIFDDDILDAQNSVNNIIKLFTIILIACFGISCIFMSSQIHIELHYRKKEIGYLQVFGLNKKRIMSLVYAGYFMKLIVSVLIAFVIYVVLSIVASIVMKQFMIFNIIHTVCIIGAIAVLYTMTVMLTIWKFLKRNIVDLIS